jgi:hypothetical protein
MSFFKLLYEVDMEKKRVAVIGISGEMKVNELIRFLQETYLDEEIRLDLVDQDESQSSGGCDVMILEIRSGIDEILELEKLRTILESAKESVDMISLRESTQKKTHDRFQRMPNLHRGKHDNLSFRRASKSVRRTTHK